jgi:hypothetical protein
MSFVEDSTQTAVDQGKKPQGEFPVGTGLLTYLVAGIRI